MSDKKRKQLDRKNAAARVRRAQNSARNNGVPRSTVYNYSTPPSVFGKLVVYRMPCGNPNRGGLGRKTSNNYFYFDPTRMRRPRYLTPSENTFVKYQ